jgi:hypothetical protein
MVYLFNFQWHPKPSTSIQPQIFKVLSHWRIEVKKLKVSSFLPNFSKHNKKKNRMIVFFCLGKHGDWFWWRIGEGEEKERRVKNKQESEVRWPAIQYICYLLILSVYYDLMDGINFSHSHIRDLFLTWYIPI